MEKAAELNGTTATSRRGTVLAARRRPSRETPAEERAGSKGQIPFCVRFGVTGHRKLEHPEEILERVVAQVKRVLSALPADASTPVELAVVSQLAEGADRLVVDAVFRAANEIGALARLEVILPMHRDLYVEVQGFCPESRDQFRRLLAQASSVLEPRPSRAGTHDRRATGSTPAKEVRSFPGSQAISYDWKADAYAAAGRRLIGHCDVLIAVWDGKPPNGRGGTADTLLLAASEGRPCIWVPTEPASSLQDNLGRGTALEFYQRVTKGASLTRDLTVPAEELSAVDTLAGLAKALERLKEFNRERLPRAFWQRLSGEFGFPGGEDDWVAPYFLRSTLLAKRYQRRFAWSARTVSCLAVGAAIALGGHVAFGPATDWDWAEVACLAAVACTFLLMHRGAFHRRWISYRFLAERFRSARFLSSVGIGFRRATTFGAVYVERHSSDWLLRAFEQLWQQKHRHRTQTKPELPFEILRDKLADKWIGAQISFHARRSVHHRRWHLLLLSTTLAAFSATFVCAIIDATGPLRQAMIFLSIALPGLGASVGALMTVTQHKALAERYRNMSSDLAGAQQAVREAGDTKELVAAVTAAANIMTEESDDWLGVLWFLDLEHP